MCGGLNHISYENLTKKYLSCYFIIIFLYIQSQNLIMEKDFKHNKVIFFSDKWLSNMA